MPGTPTPLPDQPARDAVVTRLDVNFAVEAAAGSGKTTCLVGRILALCERGLVNQSSLVAAVTFTRKAAAELRERLARGIKERLAAATADAAANLKAAEKALKLCHIGTIHSFCGRLLRERPVEAGVDPGFAELEEDADRTLRDLAWNEFTDRFYAGKNEELEKAAIDLGLSLEDLRDGFHAFASYPDVGEWPGEDAPFVPSGADELRRGLRAFAVSVSPFVQDPYPAASNDKLLPVYRRISSWAERTDPDGGADDLIPLVPFLSAKPYTVQNAWKPFFGAKYKDLLQEEENRYLRFRAECVRPFEQSLFAARYAVALACCRRAAGIHDALRRDARALNFADLLMKTARLLREHPRVRKELSSRYARLLVDEVQDTDPIQAEILFLLAGDDERERDWRKCRPRPGALFMVGDPKQSIYRFTRADIATYSLLKRLIGESGGETLSLSVNFRSQPAIVDWVNRIFGPDGSGSDLRFPDSETAFSPAYVPLRAAGKTAGDGCFSGVYLLKTLAADKKRKIGEAEILRDEAERIAGFIADAVGRGMLVHDPVNGPRPARPDDFLILTPRLKGAGPIAAELRRAALPVRVGGGGQFAWSSAPGLLVGLLEAILDPDNPIALVACLRDPLFGVSDPELYGWKKAGGEFSLFQANPPDAPAYPAECLDKLKRLERLFHDHDPTTAVKIVADRLGLWALAASGENADGETAALLTLFDRLAAERGRIAVPMDALDRMRSILRSGDFDPTPAMGDAGPAVRVMNLHKAKGLEAPIVFLAGSANAKNHPPTLAVERSAAHDAKGRLAIYRKYGKGQTLVACPGDWEEAAEREERFLKAEKARLSYVAATRAGSAVIVSARPLSKGLKSGHIAILDIDRPLPEPPPSPAPENAGDKTSPPTEPVRREEFAAAVAERAARLAAATAPTYALERAKTRKAGLSTTPAEEALLRPAGEEDALSRLVPGSEQAMALGEVLHEILESETTLADAELTALARAKLAEQELPSALADEVRGMAKGVWGSELWRRAAGAKRVFREMPFTMSSETPDGLPSLIRGVVDLVFEEEDGWVIADYKTDRIRPGSPAVHAERHRGQLAAYAEALARADPAVKVKELGVYFLRTGEYARL